MEKIQREDLDSIQFWTVSIHSKPVIHSFPGAKWRPCSGLAWQRGLRESVRNVGNPCMQEWLRTARMTDSSPKRCYKANVHMETWTFYQSERKKKKKQKEKVDVFPYCLQNKKTIKTAACTLDVLTLWLMTLAELVGGDGQTPLSGYVHSLQTLQTHTHTHTHTSGHLTIK